MLEKEKVMKGFQNPLYRNYIKEEIKARAKNWLVPARVQGYICPCCHSGDGPHGTGIVENRYKANYFACFSSRNGDCWEGFQDVIGIVKHIEKVSFFDAMIIAAKKVNYDFPDPSLFMDANSIPPHTIPVFTRSSFDYSDSFIQKPTEEQILLFQNEFKCFQQQLNQTDYFLQRGISFETAERFGCGFEPNWEHPLLAQIDIEKNRRKLNDILIEEGYGNAWNKILSSEGDPYRYMQKNHPNFLQEHSLRLFKPSPSPRVIIPLSPVSYLARDTRKPANDFQRRWTKMKVGVQTIGFNWNILLSHPQESVFVVEGEFDALSIEELGHSAVSLGSVTMVNRFCSFLKNNHVKLDHPLILCLDNDLSGKNAMSNLARSLYKIGISSIQASVMIPNTKDPNEALVRDCSAFSKRLDDAISRANQMERNISNLFR